MSSLRTSCVVVGYVLVTSELSPSFSSSHMTPPILTISCPILYIDIYTRHYYSDKNNSPAVLKFTHLLISLFFCMIVCIFDHPPNLNKQPFIAFGPTGEVGSWCVQLKPDLMSLEKTKETSCQAEGGMPSSSRASSSLFLTPARACFRLVTSSLDRFRRCLKSFTVWLTASR